MSLPVIYYVVPCYNESEALPISAPVFAGKLGELIGGGVISEKSRILFVNDGSSDDTWDIIRRLHKSDGRILGMSLSRNRGHQNALLAGLLYASSRCDAAISMDADLQDDIDASSEMIEKFKDGCDIVYGVRNSRKKDSFFKRNTARFFYKMMNALGVEMVSDSADYRLMSARALKGLEGFGEVNLFLRGIVPMIGYRSDKVYYNREERAAGESKYPLGKMLAFSIEGITSLSVSPIRVITGMGICVFLVSIFFFIWGFVQKLRGVTVRGWSSLITSVWAIGGLILLSIGIIGEYIGKIYLETKRRPRFLIDEILSDAEDEEGRDRMDNHI